MAFWPIGMLGCLSTGAGWSNRPINSPGRLGLCAKDGFGKSGTLTADRPAIASSWRRDKVAVPGSGLLRYLYACSASISRRSLSVARDRSISAISTSVRSRTLMKSSSISASQKAERATSKDAILNVPHSQYAFCVAVHALLHREYEAQLGGTNFRCITVECLSKAAPQLLATRMQATVPAVWVGACAGCRV